MMSVVSIIILWWPLWSSVLCGGVEASADHSVAGDSSIADIDTLSTTMAISTVPTAAIATMPTLCVAAVLYVFFSVPCPFSLSSFCMVSWL